MRWESVHVNARARETPEGRKSAGRTGGIWGPGKRWGHTCNSVKGGRYLYVFGGYGSDNCQTNDVHVFDSVKQTWSKPMMKGIPPSPRDSHSCTTVGSRLFVFGGTDGTSPLKDLHILDTTSNTWILPTVHGKGPDAREGHSAALVDKQLFIFGGCGKSSDNPEEVYYNDLFILDTETLVWEHAITSGTPPSPRDSHTCSSWKNQIIVLGGEDSSDCYLSDVHMLDADTLVWRKVTTSGQMLAPRAGHTTVSLGSNLFVFGGFTDARNLYDDLHVLNVDTGTWSRVLNVNQGPSARFSVAGDCLDERKGILVFIGGCNKTLEALDDMYYLHTDMPVENDQSELRQEKLSLRRELKKKCRDNYLPTKETERQNNFHMLVAKVDLPQPVYLQECSQSARRYCSTGTESSGSKSAEEVSFEAAVTNVNQFGYAIETIINGKLLRGMLFSCTSSFVRDTNHVYPSKKRMGTDTVGDKLNNYEPALNSGTVIHHQKKSSDQGQRESRVSPAGILSSNLTSSAIDANIYQQNMVSEKLEPTSMPSEYLKNEVTHGLYKPSAEKLCETRATDKAVPSTSNQVPVIEDQNPLSGGQTQESEENHG